MLEFIDWELITKPNSPDNILKLNNSLFEA